MTSRFSHDEIRAAARYTVNLAPNTATRWWSRSWAQRLLMRSSRGIRTLASGVPQPVTGSQPGPGRVSGDRRERDDHGVVAGGDVVEGGVVGGAAPDAVDGGVDEAEVVTGALVGHGDQRGPQRGAGAGAAGPDQRGLLASVLDDRRHPGGASGVGGHVGHCPGDPVPGMLSW